MRLQHDRSRLSLRLSSTETEPPAESGAALARSGQPVAAGSPPGLHRRMAGGEDPAELGPHGRHQRGQLDHS